MSKLYHFPDQSSYRNLEKNAQEILRQWCRIYLVFWWENVYGTATHKNPQNDCVYVSATLRKRHVALARLLRTRSYFSKSVMVSVGVSKLGKTQLVFVDPGVKIDGAYYRNVLLTQQLLPVTREISGSSLSPRKTVLSHTEHVRHSAFWNNRRHPRSFHRTCGPQKSRSETSGLQNLGTNGKVCLPDQTLWRR